MQKTGRESSQACSVGKDLPWKVTLMDTPSPTLWAPCQGVCQKKFRYEGVPSKWTPSNTPQTSTRKSYHVKPQRPNLATIERFPSHPDTRQAVWGERWLCCHSSVAVVCGTNVKKSRAEERVPSKKHQTHHNPHIGKPSKHILVYIGADILKRLITKD